jgi:hypothetical protein
MGAPRWRQAVSHKENTKIIQSLNLLDLHRIHLLAATLGTGISRCASATPAHQRLTKGEFFLNIKRLFGLVVKSACHFLPGVAPK